MYVYLFVGVFVVCLGWIRTSVLYFHPAIIFSEKARILHTHTHTCFVLYCNQTHSDVFAAHVAWDQPVKPVGSHDSPTHPIHHDNSRKGTETMIIMICFQIINPPSMTSKEFHMFHPEVQVGTVFHSILDGLGGGATPATT